jgi:hypothetical protein
MTYILGKIEMTKMTYIIGRREYLIPYMENKSNKSINNYHCLHFQLFSSIFYTHDFK